uniref:U3 small nucleolar RNA-associated protein 4 homolog n=1 Tax=Actinia tenebrosa TaxID=6105 RepID=A0A6P8I1P2_ACTTE
MRITMEEFESRNTLIWDVHITSDYTIITGDSLGNTQFWDGKLGTLIESYNAHKADVLSLCINEEEDTVFSAGVDSKIVSFKLTKKGQNKKWIKTNSNRVHTHDVRALAMNEPKDMLVSGGVDTKLAVYSLSKFTESNPKLVPPFPHKSFISVASDANIVMDQCQRSLRFWKLGETDVESTVIQKLPTQLLQIKAKGDNHIMCSALASCSSWVAFSDIDHVSLFKVNLLSEDATKFQVSRVLPMPPDLLPAQKMVFTPDGLKLICATNQHSIQVLEISEEVTLASTIHLPAANENDLPAMCLLAVSHDGQWLSCVDSRNAVNVIDINNNKIHSTLPTFSSYVTAMAFQPETQFLAIVCSDKQIFMYNTNTSKLTDWSKQAAAQGLPKEWVQRHQKIVGITFDPSCSDLMILQDHEIFTVIDMREPLPEPDVAIFEKIVKPEENRKRPFKADLEDKHWKAKTAKLDTVEEKGKKKGKEQKEKERPKEKSESKELKSFKICKKYKPLLFLNFCRDGALVVVERPLLSMLETLPPTLQRKRYGKT